MEALPAGFTYSPGLFEPAACAEHLARLLAEIPWEDHHLTLFGRAVPMPRRIAWFGPTPYTYSGLTHPARPLPPRVRAILARVEAATDRRFNAALLNYYRGGSDSMGWHSDDDYDHSGRPAVASVSFGATRRFQLRSRTGGERRTVDLEDGSLLLMTGDSQRRWQHAVPKTRRPVGPRVNLTFRYINPPA